MATSRRPRAGSWCTPKSLGIIAGPFYFPGLEHEIAASGAEVLLADGRLFWDLAAERAQADGVKNLGFEKDWLSYDRYARVRKALAEEIALTPSDDLIRHVRATKDTGEIEQLRRAADVADRAFRELLTRIHAGMTEREVASTLEQIMKDLGAEDRAFPPSSARGQVARCHTGSRPTVTCARASRSSSTSA